MVLPNNPVIAPTTAPSTVPQSPFTEFRAEAEPVAAEPVTVVPAPAPAEPVAVEPVRSEPDPAEQALPARPPIEIPVEVLPSQASVLADLVPGPSFSSPSLQVASESCVGRRAYGQAWFSQDSCLVLPLSRSRLLVCVFDGHGEQGHEISDSLRKLFGSFAPAALEQAADVSSICRILERFFVLAQKGLEGGGMAEWSGSTATVSLIDPAAGLLVCAHAGNSRLVMSRMGQVDFETSDHGLDSAIEERVLASGGEVRVATLDGLAAPRIYFRGQPGPGVATARSMGDLQACRLGVQPGPEINAQRLAPGSTVILATDGVWAQVSSQTAATIVAQSLGEEAAAQALVAEARRRWLGTGGDIDDITAVVIRTA